MRNLPATYFARADSRPRIMKLRLLEPITTLLQRMQEVHKEIVAAEGLDIITLDMVEGSNTVLFIQPYNMIRYVLITHNASSNPIRSLLLLNCFRNSEYRFFTLR